MKLLPVIGKLTLTVMPGKALNLKRWHFETLTEPVMIFITLRAAVTHIDKEWPNAAGIDIIGSATQYLIVNTKYRRKILFNEEGV